ncbi:hypothetical protein BOX15_Mlig020008g2 [Macrostomum lignano]|uniref:Peptidase M12B domain-containing protein n=1 Tax=Macrostomum lignano TaxID=282301 RepID=A0A267DZE2_9PLAT|nr:hypothetical protein BOX15_Mlig020008g2 [Macrostomum lignano]
MHHLQWLLILLVCIGAASAASTDCANSDHAWRVIWKASGNQLQLNLAPPLLKKQNSTAGRLMPKRLLLKRHSSSVSTVGKSGKVRTDRYKLNSSSSIQATATVVHPKFGGPDLLAGLVRMNSNGSRHSVISLAIHGAAGRGFACQLNSSSKSAKEVTLTSSGGSDASGSGGAAVLELRLDLDPSVWRHFSSSPDGAQAAATSYFGAVFGIVNRALAAVGIQIRWVLGRSRAYASLKAPGIAYLRQFGQRVPALQLLLSMEALADWQKDDRGGYDHHMLITRDRSLLPPASLGPKPKGARLIGLSYVASACQPNSRSVITDLYPAATARLIAHELGHVLGATDSPPNSSREANYLMESDQSRPAHLSRLSRLFTYSAASRSQIKKFLSSSRAGCLRKLSNPASQLWVPEGPAGSAEDQCRHMRQLAFAGPTAHAKILSPPKTTRYLCRPVRCSNGSHSARLLLMPGTLCIPRNKKSRCQMNMICSGGNREIVEQGNRETGGTGGTGK